MAEQLEEILIVQIHEHLGAGDERIRLTVGTADLRFLRDSRAVFHFDVPRIFSGFAVRTDIAVLDRELCHLRASVLIRDTEDFIRMELEAFHTILYPAENELHFIRPQIGGGTFCVRAGSRGIILYNYADVGIDPLTGSVLFYGGYANIANFHFLLTPVLFFIYTKICR